MAYIDETKIGRGHRDLLAHLSLRVILTCSGSLIGSDIVGSSGALDSEYFLNERFARVDKDELLRVDEGKEGDGEASQQINFAWV